MIKKVAMLALAAALASTTVISTAEAGPGRGRGYDNHKNYNAYNRGHQGRGHKSRGHYRNGKWIALGILGAAAAAAVANSDDGRCYTRRGRRYCD